MNDDGPGAHNAELVELGDLDELVRQTDRLVDARDWAGLVDLRDRSRRALERGRQLWPVASLAEYRLALEAPPEWAAVVIVDGTGRFALGPLPEVAASTHTWQALAPHVTPGPAAVLCAHERVVRGEDLSGVELPGPTVIDLPQRLQPWEPTYPTATYRPASADFPRPSAPAPTRAPRCESALPIADESASVEALRNLAQTWTTESNGRAEAIVVEGSARQAIAALGPRTVRMGPIGPAETLALMAWTAASGGAHGRRRGMARGRFEAWWALAAVTGLDDPWPPDPDALGTAADELRWFVWDAAEPATGWELRLAVEDPAENLAWALAATDQT